MQAEFPGIKTRSVEADFSLMGTMQEYKKLVLFNLTDLNIGILILNAGVFNDGTFSELSTTNKIEESLFVNAIHVVYLLKMLLPHLHKRKHRSAVLITSCKS